MSTKQMKSKTQEFLSTRKKIQPLNDIVKEFEVSFGNWIHLKIWIFS